MKHLNTNNRISEEDYDEMLNDVTPDLDIPSCWSNLKNNEYAPAYPTVPKVPAGVYEIGWNSGLSSYTVKKQPFKTDELYHLPSYEITDILKDIDNFIIVISSDKLLRYIITSTKTKLFK